MLRQQTHTAVVVVALLLLGVASQGLALTVDAGAPQVVAMHDLSDPNSPVDPNLLDPSHPRWPVAFATDPNSPLAPVPVTVPLAGSHDVNTPVTVAWTVPDPNQAALVTLDNATVLDPNATFAAPGLYGLALTVDDGTGPVTDTVEVKVKLAGHALQAHWKFDGDPNDPNDFDWHYTSFTGAPDFDTGVVGDALKLRPGDSVSYGRSVGGETSISVAFWMKPSSDASKDSSQGLVRKYSGTSSDPQGGWTFQLRSETELRFRCSSGWDGGAGDLKVLNNYPPDTWTHIVGTYDAATGRMVFYKNGQAVASRSANDTCFDDFVDELTVGSDKYAGLVDDLYVFDYPLDVDEIRPLVAKGLNVAPAVHIARDQAKLVLPDDTLSLAATVVEEGPVSAVWTVAEQPEGAVVTLTDPGALTTEARFTTPGNYRLRLTVTDQGTPPLSDTGDMVVKVRPAGFDGLEAHITFNDNNADSHVATSVPYVGQITGDPEWVEGVLGNADSAILLDGEDDHIDYDAYLGSDPCCTIALWVGNDAVDSDSHIIQKWASDSSRRGWLIRNRVQDMPGQVAVMIGSGFSGAGAYQVTDAQIPPVQWTHLALTFDGATLKVYLNSAEVLSEPVDGTVFSPADLVTPMVIGYRSNDQTRFFKGAIDEVRIYDRALSAEDLRALYEADGGQ